MLRSKRGEEIFKIPAYLILLMAFFLPLYLFFGQAGQGTTYERNYLSTDLALTLDSVQAVDGKVALLYPHTVDERLSVKITNGSVRVFQEAEMLATEQPFQPSADYSVEERTITPLLGEYLLSLRKNGETILVDQRTGVERAHYRYRCQSEAREQKRIIISSSDNELAESVASQCDECVTGITPAEDELDLRIEMGENAIVASPPNTFPLACQVANRMTEHVETVLKPGERFSITLPERDARTRARLTLSIVTGLTQESVEDKDVGGYHVYTED